VTSQGLLDATALAEKLRAKELSSRELLELFLDRIDRINPVVNAVVTLDIARAREAAGRADQAAARDEWAGPLHGLPTTIKDAIETAGLLSTGGAFELATHVPDRDAPAVSRLRQAGAVVFGKTNVPRWSGDIQTFNELFGVPYPSLTRVLASARCRLRLPGRSLGRPLGFRRRERRPDKSTTTSRVICHVHRRICRR
jgi:amidase